MYRHSTPSRIDQLWSEQKAKLRLQFIDLTDEDLKFETGRKYEMMERLSTKLGKTPAEIDVIFKHL
jgi:hypothetical protein